MQVCDDGCPNKCAIKLLTVNVNRNRFSPVFASNSYAAVISEEASFGTSILSVTASDADVVVSSALRTCYQ